MTCQKFHDFNFDPLTLDLHVIMHALDKSSDKNILIQEQPHAYAVADWALVTCHGDSQSYPAEIMEAHENNLQIKVMERAGGNFK